MPSLDPVRTALIALKESAARLIHGKQAPALVVMRPGETVEAAIKRVCGDKGLPRVMMNGRPVPNIIVYGVEPTNKSTAEDE